MRTRYITSDASSFDLHDHVAWCGVGDAFDRMAVGVFSAAARRGDQLYFVCERPDPERLVGLEDCEELLERGALVLAEVGATYAKFADPSAQREVFESQLERAISSGYRGICVVADNSSMANGNDEEFAAWLAWETMADRLQATRPVTGICYFDRQVVQSARLADLSATHPVLSVGFAQPRFQVYVDDDAVRVTGDIDHWAVEQLRRILTVTPNLPELALDLSDVGFLDHGALVVLNQLAREGRPLRVRGARTIVRRVFELLDLPHPGLEFD